jgi:tetratricopeptide (TPR) repeat protein/tRNA A-37 threonylcarbamoyl transferase component Bud32
MPESFATADNPLPPEQALHVNEVCDRFEAAWRAAAPGTPGPRIEDHLDGTDGAERSALLRHLVLLEIDYRRLRGEEPTASDYGSRFPELSGRFLAEGLAMSPAAAPAQEGGGMAEVETTVYAPPLQPQVRSPRYAVGKFHDRGGIGEVWLAKDTEIGRQVALKRLRPNRLDHKERFLAEAQITGQLEHPGIVPVHDLGIDENGQAFYVMSFIRGRSLLEAIEAHHAGGPVSAEAREVERVRLLEVFVKVCQAVAYAHHRGVIHRDMKPDNVMLGPFGEAVVLDWGMAKVLNQPELPAGAEPVQPSYSGGSGETAEGAVMGAPAYMAPEMAAGRAAEADERTDVYLLGATLYHVLTGRAPREGTSQSEVMALARTASPPSPRRLRPDVPRALDAVCTKAMAHRPADRYAGALALAQDVERYLAGAPVSAYREPLPARVWRWCKRHPRALGRAAAAALALALVVAGGAWVREILRRAEQDVREAEAAKRDAELQAQEVAEKKAKAEQEAEQHRRREQARNELADFRRLVDEQRYFYAPNTTPAGEGLHALDSQARYYDTHRGQAAGEQALRLADRLTKELAELGLAEERATLDEELRALLLMTAQAHPPRDGKAAAELLARLDRAAPPRPSPSYHRLRALCYRVLGDEPRAAEEERNAKAAPPVALDHFLQAEKDRARAFAPVQTLGDDLAWRPNRELLRQAVVEYRLALRGDPGNFWYHLQLGRCYLSLDQGAAALEALGTCVALRPDGPWGYSARGLTLGLVQRYAEGEADLNKALEIDSKFRPARLHRGLLALLQRKDARALEDFAELLQPGKERMIEAAYYRGQLRLLRKEYEQALEDFDAVVKDDEHFRPVYLSRAQTHILRDDTLRGLADLTTFLDLGRRSGRFDPKDPALFAARGRLLLQLIPKWGLPPSECLAKLPLARAELETARKMGHRTAELFDDLGSVAERLGDYEQALDAYGESLKLDGPKELAVKVRTKRGWILAWFLQKRQFEQARKEFTEAIRLNPAYADAHAGLGFVAAVQGAPGEALLAANRASALGADDYMILHNVACVYAELSRVEKGRQAQHQDAAMDLLRRAVTLCRREGGGDREIQEIKGDASLKVLADRPDYRALVTGEGRE